MNRLNFGCGSIQPEGWINVDYDPSFNALPDLSTIEDGSLDIVVAHASIQQVPWHGLVDVLTDLYKKLNHNGVIRISLPDIEKGFQAYFMGAKDWFPNSEEDIDDRFSAWLTWYSTSCTLITPQALSHKLTEAGFMQPTRVDFGKRAFGVLGTTQLDTREKEFYFMEAQK